MFLLHIWPPARQCYQLQVILSYWENQLSQIDSLTIKICPLYQILQIQIPDFPISFWRSSGSTNSLKYYNHIDHGLSICLSINLSLKKTYVSFCLLNLKYTHIFQCKVSTLIHHDSKSIFFSKLIITKEDLLKSQKVKEM